MSYAHRVRDGVAALDDRYPGWHRQIDLSQLDMHSCLNCVLGQLYGSFVFGATMAGVADEESEFGFDVPYAWRIGEAEMHRRYRVLNRLWSYVIRQRQAGA